MVKIMRQSANKENNKNDLTDIVRGTVTSENPLRIKVEDRFEIDKSFLILSNFCFRKEFNGVVLWEGLKRGDKVVMLRVSNGQEFYVFGRDNK